MITMETEKQEHTIIKGTQREFNFRWWCWGISAFIIGIIGGWMLF